MPDVEYKGINARTANNTKGIRTYSHTHQFNVINRDYAREYIVGSQPEVPLIGSRHPDDVYAFCESLDVQMVTMHANWTVTANYTTAIEMDVNPYYDPAIIEWDGENFEEVAIYDRSENAILNSAGDPFENVMRERTRRVVTVVKNVTSIPSWIVESEDAVNSAEFMLDGILIPEGLAKLGAPRIGRVQWRGIYPFREMTMVIKLNKDGWALTPLDAGFRYRDDDGNLARCVSDGDGTDVTQPIPLNGFGKVLTDPTPSRAIFGDYDVYPSFDFSVLPLT